MKLLTINEHKKQRSTLSTLFRNNCLQCDLEVFQLKNETGAFNIWCKVVLHLKLYIWHREYYYDCSYRLIHLIYTKLFWVDRETSSYNNHSQHLTLDGRDSFNAESQAREQLVPLTLEADALSNQILRQSRNLFTSRKRHNHDPVMPQVVHKKIKSK